MEVSSRAVGPRVGRSAAGRTRHAGFLYLWGQAPGGTYMCAEVCWRTVCVGDIYENFIIFDSFSMVFRIFYTFFIVLVHFGLTVLYCVNFYSVRKREIALTLGCVWLLCVW